VFSPDGKRIAYDTAGDIWTMHTDGSHKQRLTFDPGTDEYADWGVRP
jgi:Tol biopolymer transport system component